jgi:hypothetical protein
MIHVVIMEKITIGVILVGGRGVMIAVVLLLIMNIRLHKTMKFVLRNGTSIREMTKQFVQCMTWVMDVIFYFAEYLRINSYLVQQLSNSLPRRERSLHCGIWTVWTVVHHTVLCLRRKNFVLIINQHPQPASSTDANVQIQVEWVDLILPEKKTSSVNLK